MCIRKTIFKCVSVVPVDPGRGRWGGGRVGEAQEVWSCHSEVGCGARGHGDMSSYSLAYTQGRIRYAIYTGVQHTSVAYSTASCPTPFPPHSLCILSTPLIARIPPSAPPVLPGRGAASALGMAGQCSPNPNPNYNPNPNRIPHRSWALLASIETAINRM